MAGNRAKDTDVTLGGKGAICAKCGKDNLPDSRFCCYCGAEIGVDTPAFKRADDAPRKGTGAERERSKAKDGYVGALPAWDVLPPAIPVVRRRRR